MKYRAAHFGVFLPGALVLAVFIWVWTSTPAFARELHAVLLRSNPAEGSILASVPASVQLWFSEPVQLAGQAITVLDPEGKAVRQGPVYMLNGELEISLDASHKTGTYLVTWDVISQDTHPASGQFVFSVGHVGGIWANSNESGVSVAGDILQVLARLLHFLGYALGFGPLLFRQLVLRPLRLENSQVVERRLRRIIGIGIVLLLLAEPLALLAQTTSLGTSFDANLIGGILASSFGRVQAQRLGAAILLWVLMGIAQQYADQSIVVALLLGVGLAFIDGQASHAITAQTPWLGLLANTLHIAAMGTWIGGLVALLAIWHLSEVQGQHNELVIVFGRLALLSVIELLLTGIVMTWLHLTRPTDLLTTPYGRVLVVKVIALLLPLVFAFMNRRSIHRHLRWWMLEIAGLLGVVILAGLLASLPPPI